MNKTAKIFVAGHRGMVGSALVRALQAKGYGNVITQGRETLNLLHQTAVDDFIRTECPDYIFIAAAKVGGIHANNTQRAEFLYQNLAIETNLIHAAHEAGVQRLMFLGSSCIYPRDCPQPIKEEYLLTGPLEATNEAYAIAKIAGIKLCEAYNHQYGRQYISVMPTNLFGLNDNYDPASSHVLPALIRKAYEAKKRGDSHLTIWGSGMPRREFLFADDLADACVFLMEKDYNGSILNIGTGEDISIRELAIAILRLVGVQCKLNFDSSKPDGTPRKVLDVSKIRLEGWKEKTSLEEGLKITIQNYLKKNIHI